MKETKILKLTDQQLNVILYALQKQPFELVNELIKDLAGQIQTQLIEQENKPKE